jgi:hypothetical protein
MFKSPEDAGYEVLALHHAEAIMTHDMPLVGNSCPLVAIGIPIGIVRD